MGAKRLGVREGLGLRSGPAASQGDTGRGIVTGRITTTSNRSKLRPVYRDRIGIANRIPEEAIS